MFKPNKISQSATVWRVRRIAPFVALLCCASAVNADDQVPFHGTFEGVDRAVLTPCTTVVEKTAEGQATHLGRFTLTTTLFTADSCTTFPVMQFEADLVTLTTANGDQLFGTASGASTLVDFTDPTQIRVLEEATVTITGGTGRFAHSTGTIQWSLVAKAYEGTTQPDGSTVLPTVATMEGTLSSIGADKK